MWILLLVISTSVAGVRAQTTPTISVYPTSYEAENIGVIFQTNVTVQGVTDLAGFEFKLGYDTAVLTATEIVDGGIYESYFPLISEIYDAEGYLHYSVMELTGVVSFDGDGILATITFNATGLGETALDLYDTILGDSLGDPITHDLIDGQVTVVPEFPAALIMPLFLIVTLVAVILTKTVWSRKRRAPSLPPRP